MSLFEFWRGREERGAVVKRATQLRLHPSQLRQLHDDSVVRAELHEAGMASLLPPVGTEVFRRFSTTSLKEIQQRHEAEKEQQKRENNEVEKKDQPKPATHLEAGKALPFIYGDPPPELLNTPLEELDPFYQSQKTFIVLSKGSIYRFNAESACYLLSPFNPIRTAAIRILLHSLFQLFILVTLLTNSCIMTMSDPPAWTKTAEYVFTAIYTFEVIIKIASRGFCIGRFTFLRDPWNWLDIMVVSMAFLTQFVDLEIISVLSTFPRAMKMISVYPGMKTTASTLVQSVRKIADSIILTVFVLSILAMIGLHVFSGRLKQKCFIWPINMTDIYYTNGTINRNFDFYDYISKSENYYYVPGEIDPLVCGNSSTTRGCPEGFTCLKAGKNPNYGFTNYDSIGWSLLSLFRLMTLDFWESLMQLMMQAGGKPSVILFVLFVLPCCFCLVSLILAVVAMAFVEQDKANFSEAKRREEEFIQIQEVMKRREKEEQAACREELSEKQDPAPQEKNSASVIRSPEQKHPAEGGSKQDQRSCPPCCITFLRWNCCGCWRWLKQGLYTFISNPFFDLGIVTCLILNALFMAMVHYPMTEKMYELLVITNLVFTGIFIVEMLLKLVAMDPYGYFQVPWNIFDSIVVAISLLDIALQDVEGIFVLRLLITVRMLRLARWWPTLHMFIKIVWTSVWALRNLTFTLLITVFIFAAGGMQLFKKDYRECVCRISEDCMPPRWHMSDFFHAFMVIFRILCGEWIETMWDCMEVSGQGICLVFFMMVIFIGNLLVLNLFLALLLSSVSGDDLKEKEKNNLHIAINQIKGGVTWICTLLGKKDHINPDDKVVDSKTDKKEYLSLTPVTSGELVSKVKAPESKDEIKFKMPENGDKEKEKQHDEEVHHRKSAPESCCCDSCYHCCPFLDVDMSQGVGKFWSNFRRACFSIVQHKHFENFIIFIILLSSAALAFEDIHLQHRQVLQMVLDKADLVFTCLFLLEMVLKWFACGFKKYFTSASCWLDFLILAVSLMSSAAGMLGYSELRTVRALRPLRALSRFQGLRVVLKALVVTLPPMIDILLVSLLIWLIFSITGVYLFAGKFSFCSNETSEEYFSPEMVSNYSDCLTLVKWNYTGVRWKSVKINYDSVGAGYLSLFQVATFKGWLDVMYSAVDSTQVESQPEYESNVYMYLYFVCFIIIGRFFTFNLFIRVFINTLDQQRHKFGGRHVFMTEQQQKCSRAIKKQVSREHQTPVPRPQNKCQALLFDLVTKQSFEVFMIVVICLQMVTLMVETDPMSMWQEEMITWLMLIFNIIFLIEFLLKIIALRNHYFSDCLNIVDFVVIFISIIGMAITDLMYAYFIPPVYLLVLRLARISRVIHLVPCAQRIWKLLVAFMMSLPALFNICLLLFLLMFTFSIFGMMSFAYVKKEALINDVFNFETFVDSMISMFTITTTAGWDGLLLPILNTPPDCDPHIENPGSTVTGNCGSPTVGIIFFVSYIMISLLLVPQLYIAVILEIFNMDDTEHLNDDDLQMFYKTWKKFDPNDSQVIQYSQLSDFCDSLRDPLRIPKPNNIKLIHMDLPLLPGDKIHCMDVLLALTAQVFGDSGDMDVLKAKMKERFTSSNSKVAYEPISSTLQRKQEERAVKLIQRAYRKHRLQDRDAEEMVAEPAAGASVV